jgi:hypothetical protein
MLQIEREQTNDHSVLRVDDAARRRLADVLADWLCVYAGVQPHSLSRENFDLVVELRRVLLSPDEHRADGTVREGRSPIGAEFQTPVR